MVEGNKESLFKRLQKEKQWIQWRNGKITNRRRPDYLGVIPDWIGISETGGGIETVDKAVTILKNGKVPGHGGVSPELLK